MNKQKRELDYSTIFLSLFLLALFATLFFFNQKRAEIKELKEQNTALEEKYSNAIEKKEAINSPEFEEVKNTLNLYYNYDQDTYYERFKKLKGRMTPDMLNMLQGANTDNEKPLEINISSKLSESQLYLSERSNDEYIAELLVDVDTEGIMNQMQLVVKIHMNKKKEIDKYEILVNKAKKDGEVYEDY